MPQSPLVVTVTEPETGASWAYVFEQGPVVVGRGDGVQLCLDRPFVSLQHGSFDFDDRGITYVDLDSRNGTLIDGVARAGDHPVPVSEATDLRIGKLRLTLSRTAPVKPAGDEPPSPFAPRPARGPVKGTDALPREELEQLRRELLRKKEAPAPAMASPSPPAPVLPPFEAPPSMAPPPPSAPGLEKTMPVPELAARQLPEATPAGRSPYTPGATQAVPAPRLPARPSRPRPVDRRPVRRAPPPPRRRGVWLPVGLGLLVVAAAVSILVVSGLRQRPHDGDESGEVTGTGGLIAPSGHQPVQPPVATPEPAPQARPAPPPPNPPPIALQPKHPVHPVVRPAVPAPAPKPPPPPARGPNGSLILP